MPARRSGSRLPRPVLYDAWHLAGIPRLGWMAPALRALPAHPRPVGGRAAAGPGPPGRQRPRRGAPAVSGDLHPAGAEVSPAGDPGGGPTSRPGDHREPGVRRRAGRLDRHSAPSGSGWSTTGWTPRRSGPRWSPRPSPARAWPTRPTCSGSAASNRGRTCARWCRPSPGWRAARPTAPAWPSSGRRAGSAETWSTPGDERATRRPAALAGPGPRRRSAGPSTPAPGSSPSRAATKASGCRSSRPWSRARPWSAPTSRPCGR